jgi:hypothetical protein
MLARDVADAERAALGLTAAYRVVVVVDTSGSEQLVETGVALLGKEDPAELLLTRFERSGPRVEVGAGLLGQLAGIAEGFDALQVLVRHAREVGATAQVRSQASDDPARDLVRQVDAVEADVLLMRHDDPSVREALARTDCAVVLSSGPLLPGPISVRPGPGDDGMAAIEQGLRIALREGRPLVLAASDDRRNDKRAEELSHRLAQAGLDVTSGTAVGSVLTGCASSFPGALRVRAAKQDKGEALLRLVDALTVLPPVP